MARFNGLARACFTAVALSLAPLPAVTQEASETTSTDEETRRMDTMTVTAQRREQSLQDVPLSVLGISGEQIELQRIERPDDLLLKIPGGFFIPNVKTASYVGLRGLLSFEDAPAADLPIAFFIDDVYVSGIGESNVNLFDLERIEVLRGPQGTLFGRNVVGGAFSIVSRKPSFEPEARAKVTVGSYNRIDIDGFATGPIIEDVLAGKISFSSRNAEGFVYNRVRDEDIESDGMASLRGQLLFTPSEDLTILLGADMMIDDGRGNAAKLTTFPGGASPELIPPLSSDPFAVDTDADTFFDRHLWGLLGRADWDTDLGTLTSITAFRRNDSNANRDVDGTSLFILDVEEVIDNRQFTQEVRFASTDDQPITYVAGAFYLDARNIRDERQDWNPLPGTGLGDTDAFLGTLGFPVGLKDTSQLQQVDITSYAVFGEATWHATDAFRLSVGGRYTIDEKSGFTNVTGTPNAFNGAPVFAEFSEDWDAFTPRFIVEYDVSDDVLVYANVANGYKSGGFASALTTVEGLTTPFDPENSWNYEIGAKTQWYDGRLTVNATVFQQNTEDLQFRTFNQNGVSVVDNAGEAEVRGLELETAAAPADGLSLFFNYAFLDTEFVELELGGVDLSGNKLPFAPEHSITTGFTYVQPAWRGGELIWQADFTYKTEVEFREQNDVPDEIKDLSVIDNLLNASLTYTSADDRWEFGVFGKNILDEEVLHSATDLTSFWFTADEAAAGERGFLSGYNRPQVFGASVGYRF